MACETLTQQTVALNVSAGSLPEGFCPASIQELFDALVSRLIVTPNQAFTSFAIGSVEPTSNVGPWFKDCQEFFFFDESTSSYRPIISRGNFDNMEFFSSSSTFVVPEFIYKIKVQAWGGGGGGSGQFGVGTPGSGGGAGGMTIGIFNVLPGQAIPFLVGTGGGGGTSIGGAGGNGGNTTFLTMAANGGSGAPATVHFAGKGGSAAGGNFNVIGGYGDGGDNDPGVGGSSSQGGQGGVTTWGGAPEADSMNGRLPGGGGAGGNHSGTGAQVSGGSGAGGGILIQY